MYTKSSVSLWYVSIVHRMYSLVWVHTPKLYTTLCVHVTFWNFTHGNVKAHTFTHTCVWSLNWRCHIKYQITITVKVNYDKSACKHTLSKHKHTHPHTHPHMHTHRHTDTHTEIKHSIDANGNFAISVFNMHNEVFHIKPLPYSVIMWWGKILANWQPFTNVLPTNIIPTLIYSIGTYFYNFILERVLVL